MPRSPRPSVSQLRQQADRLAASGKAKEAAVLYRRLIDENPESADLRNRLADALAATGSAAEAAATWGDAALLYERDGFIERAIALYRKVCRQSATNPEPHERLAALRRQLGHSVEAAAHDADAAVAWATRGHMDNAYRLIEPTVDALLAGRQARAAAERLERLLSVGTPHPRTLLKLASAYQQLGSTPDIARTYASLSQAHRDADQLDLALAAMDVAMRLGIGERARPSQPSRPSAAEIEVGIERAARELRRATAIVITAGSAANIPHLADYRDPQSFASMFPMYAAEHLTFPTLADARTLRQSPELAWGFYGQVLMRRHHDQPTPAMRRLLPWMTRPEAGAFVVTSSVDGLLAARGFDRARIVECYGAADRLQCTEECGIDPFPITEAAVDVDERGRARSPLPECPRCHALARPNVLLYGDYGWNSRPLYQQETRLRGWLEEVASDPRARLVVLECAEAAEAGPSLRLLTEQLRTQRRARVIRISTEEWRVPVGEIGLPLTVDEAMRRIEQAS
jgi:NAD-dependent SIR2 family protein deacetylase